LFFKKEMSNPVNPVSQVNSTQSYPFFTGVRVNSSTIPTNLPINPQTGTPVTYVLSSPTNTLYKRNGNSYMSKQMTSPFRFYDVNSELMHEINIGLSGNCNTQSTSNSSGTVMTSTSGPVYASVSPNTFTANGVNTNSSTSITVAAPLGTDPQTVANSINASASLSAPAPSGVSLNANLAKFEPNASHIVATQLRDSQIYVGPLQVNGPHQIGDRHPVGMIVHARATNKSIVSASDAGAYTAGHATNCSILHSDNDAGHVHAFARENSKALSLGHGSTTAGEASCGSVLVSGGVPNFSTSNGSKNSRFRLMLVGDGAVRHRRNVYALGKNTRCPSLDTLLEDATPNRNIPPLGCQVCTTITTGEHAPGFGHGSLVHGVATSNSLIQTSGDGATALGIADCNGVHAAAGRASFVQGLNNLALAPYSQATGHNSVSHMYGQQVQGIKGANNTNVPDSCDVCQHSKVLTHNHTQCEIVVDGTTITGFCLTYRLVLPSTPEDPIVNTPDGITITNFHLPSLICPSVAGVEVQVVSPAVIDSKTGLPYLGTDSFTARYCFHVERKDRNDQACHSSFIPSGGVVPICAFSPAITFPPIATGATSTSPCGDTTSPVIEADPEDNICGGFTLVFKEFVPTFINSVPNPRISPTPTSLNTVYNVSCPRTHTVFNVYSRIFCGYFEWVQASSGFSRVACVPTACPVSTVITAPAFVQAPPLTSCPPANYTQTNSVSQQVFAGSEFTVESNAFNFIQDMNQGFSSH
jgi:hypothetical protein